MDVDNSGIMVQSMPLLGICNLCLHDGVVKSMLIETEHDGEAETYIEMLSKCFSIDVLMMDLEDTKRLICFSCINELEHCLSFKEKVKSSLKTLEDMVKLQRPTDDAVVVIKQEIQDPVQDVTDPTVMDVKEELAIEDQTPGNCDDDSENNHMGSIDNGDYLIKQEVQDLDQDDTDNELVINEEDSDDYVPKKSRRKALSESKKEVNSVKKSNGTSETQKMLEAGLFPFKIYKDGTYHCVMCRMKSSNLDDVKSHVTDHSVSNIHVAFKKINSSKLQWFLKTSNKLRCKLCKSDLSDYSELRQHVETCIRLNSPNRNKLPFKLEKDQLDCPVCKKRFLNFVNLNNHMNIHYPNHDCKDCGKSFASQARLRGHMRSHELGEFPCRYCAAVFDKVSRRENHESKDHKSGLRYSCKRCNITQLSFYARQKHLAEVHNEELKRYKCNECPRSYITPGHLSGHVRRVHLNVKNHKCDKCDLAFYTKDSLRMHMIKHDGERIHTCDICQKSYQRLKTLREHMKIHNNDKRFVCTVCGRAFTQKCTLIKHLNVHEKKLDVEEKQVQPLSDAMVTSAGGSLFICIEPLSDNMDADDTGIMVQSLPLLGICNLCLHEGVVKSMLIESEHGEGTETYIEMLSKCFSIDVLTVDLEDTKRLICFACINELEHCLNFKEKAKASLKTLEETVKLQKQAVKNVKEELAIEDLIAAGCDDDSDNNQVGSTDDAVYGVKQEIQDLVQVTDVDMLIKEEESDDYHPKKSRRKTLSSAKRKVSFSVKKSTDTTDTEKMIKAGLFPFKINKDRTYSCVICPIKSTNLDDIKSHISDHSISNIHIAFKKISSSKRQRFYKSSNKLRCKLCKTDLSDYSELSQHVETCIRANSSRWNKLPFKLEKDQLDCPVCKKRFLNFVNLNTHMNIHYPNHICENCGKSFASQARLRAHMRTHEFGDFPCRYCDAVFDRVTRRQNHESKFHKFRQRYACKRCNISLSSFYTRQKHLAEVHNEELKRYKCKACPQSYITPGHLSSHVRRDHLNERNHKCDKCDLAFYTKNALKMHMIKHDGERIHACHICQKSYQRLKTLREHMRIHNNDKRFVCTVCGRAFTQKCTLKGHLKVHERKFDGDDRQVQPPGEVTTCASRSLVICRIEPPPRD
ncbi:zinc finger protein 11-like [Battus philenor]|uniref:zinc finger protein 11-like n=1 Tax=Battus philenor TaxID=42288 RepID=UPI0035D0E87F